MMVPNRQCPRAILAALALVLLLGLALAGVTRPAHAAGAEPLLPNLVADPPDNVSLATDSSTGSNRLLLRFNGYVHNKGPGAVDFRGSREKPKVSKAVEEEVERAREKAESLPQKVEEELATPPMKVFQRLFTTNTEETNIERPHVEEPSAGEMIYVSADGHHHWHLQRVAKYSLWNGAKTAEAAPAAKVGFCLEDSQHVEPIGPEKAVYADNVAPFRAFCQQYRPNATSLFEGISPGWRDVYSHELAFQWVDVSSVLPGEYWLREDVNPLGVIRETGGANAPAYATSPTIVPGFDALAQTTGTQTGEARTVTLQVKAWNDSVTPKYTIVSQPLHGKLGAVNGNQVTYTPNAGYVGADSFTFSAADPNSEFPKSPAVATVSIEVTAATPRVLLAGDATSTYTVGDQTTAGREEAFQFTASSTGTVEEMQFRTNGLANTGVTGVVLGVFADSAGKPGEVLGQATVWGELPVNSWIKATGLSAAVVSGTKYWLVLLPLGEAAKKLHYNVAVAAGGAGNVESKAGGLSALTAESTWETYNQGPVGFQALGRTAQASVTIEGAPARMTAGTSVQLSAKVLNDSPTVTWKASAGSITTGGLYTAPAEPPAGGTAVVTATSSKGAHDQRTIEITPARVLLAGDATSTYTVGDQTTAGREEAFQFTAASSGTVEEMQFRTNAVANTGVTGVVLGVFADSAGKPGEVLGQATASGEPAVNAWIKATGLRAAVVSATKYWLVVLPLGEGTKKLHYNVAVTVGGAGNVESKAGGLASLTAQASWETYNQGPVGFQALGPVAGTAGTAVAGATGTSPVGAAGASSAGAAVAPHALARASSAKAMPAAEPLPSVAIAGAPSSLVAGTSVQISAAVANDRPGVTWSTSAGSISSGGLYTAPSVSPAGTTVSLTARSARGGEDRRTIAIVPVPPAAPAPTAPLPGEAAATSMTGAGGPKAALSPIPPGVSRPEAMLVGHTLVMTARASAAGRVGLGAYLDGRALGGCAIQTPAGRSFTCRLALAKRISLNAPISASASWNVGDRTLRSLRPAAPVARMKMDGIFGATQIVVHGHLVAASQFLCDGALLGQLHPTALR
ncbi:MAG: lysyl oxidase family protein [Solirubrobacterales bacterium]